MKQILKKSKSKFPSISRIITDLWKKHWKIWIMITSLFLYLGTVVAVYDLYKTYEYSRQVSQDRENVRNQIAHWEEVAKKYPGYRDAYFTLAVLAYRLREKGRAQKYLEKVFILDPNFEKGRELEKLLK